jgi:hypothetical protein
MTVEQGEWVWLSLFCQSLLQGRADNGTIVPQAVTLLTDPPVSRRCTIPASASHPTVYLQSPRQNQLERSYYSRLIHDVSVRMHRASLPFSYYMTSVMQEADRGGVAFLTLK